MPNSGLIERLEKATGPDRDLDLDIWCAVYAPDAVAVDHNVEAPPYTGSIDAVLPLLPPWSWRVGNLSNGHAFADLGTQPSLQCIEGATPAIALCIAMFKAKTQAGT